jgi:hypothetical protein
MEYRFTLLGARSSGKSTWLAMLYDGLARGEVRRFRRAAKQPGDRKAWEQLVTAVREGRYASRTPDVGAFPQLHLEVTGGWREDTRVMLEASDYLGEELERNFSRSDHAWTDAWERRANADAFILVVRPTHIDELPQIPAPTEEEMRKVRALFPGRLFEMTEQSENESLIPTDISPQFLPPAAPRSEAPRGTPPTLLMLVEMLQMIRSRRGWAIGERPENVRVAVVLSAWDAVQSSVARSGPDRYLREKLPLLYDFVWSNFDPSNFRAFGLSATGGDLDDERFRRAFTSRTEALSSVVWTASGDDCRYDDDLSLPFAWAMAGDIVLDSRS